MEVISDTFLAMETKWSKFSWLDVDVQNLFKEISHVGEAVWWRLCGWYCTRCGVV
jgi:hypothetical protein